MAAGGDGSPAEQGAGQADGLVATLLGLRDELAAAASLVVALAMACRALDIARAERSALAELGSLARDRFEAILAALDTLISRSAVS